MTKGPESTPSINKDISTVHELHIIELEDYLADLNAFRQEYHEKLSSALDKTPELEFQNMRNNISIMVNAISRTLTQIINTSQTPKEAWGVIPLYTFNPDYLQIQDEHELPTLMSVEKLCRARAIQLGGTGNMRKYLQH